MNLTGRRIVVAHNPHSSRSKLVDKQVLARLDAAGYIYETIEVKQAPLVRNVNALKSKIRSGDIVISAAGDGSAHAVAHALIAAGKSNVALGFLGFGNFNDLPKAFNRKTSQRDPVKLLESGYEQTVFPLMLKANGRAIRGALLYATIGWTAQAASRFDDPKVRGKARPGMISSIWRLGLFYLRSKKNSLLPPLCINGEPQPKTSDILCVNGPTLARLFKTGKICFAKPTFFVRRLNVRWLLPNIPFLIGGLIGVMRGDETDRLTVKFAEPAELAVQCDGEVIKLKSTRSLEVCKATAGLTIISDI